MYHFRQIECCDTLNQYCCLRTISGTYNRPSLLFLLPQWQIAVQGLCYPRQAAGQKHQLMPLVCAYHRQYQGLPDATFLGEPS